MDGGAASRAGLLPGDVLLKLDDEVLTGVDDLHRLLTVERAQSECVLSVLRAKEIKTIAIVPDTDD